MWPTKCGQGGELDFHDDDEEDGEDELEVDTSSVYEDRHGDETLRTLCSSSGNENTAIYCALRKVPALTRWRYSLLQMVPALALGHTEGKQSPQLNLHSLSPRKSSGSAKRALSRAVNALACSSERDILREREIERD